MIRIQNKYSKAEATITEEQWAILVRKGWAKRYLIIDNAVAAMPAKGKFIPSEIKSIKEVSVTPIKIKDEMPDEINFGKKKRNITG